VDAVYEQFGARVEGDTVTFRLFVPNPARYGDPEIDTIRAVGDFQPAGPWDLATAPVLTRQPNGNDIVYVHEQTGLVPGFYQYKYHVTYTDQSTRWISDPCTRQVAGPENAGFVVGDPPDRAVPLDRRRPLADLVIYELMIEEFTAAFRGDRAPIDAVRDKLDHLQQLGVNAVELMPWTAWAGGRFDWGYMPILYFAVEDRYVRDPQDPLRRLDRLKELINALHERDMAVVMDGVFNHVGVGEAPGDGFPYHWLYRNPDASPYTGIFAEHQFGMDLDFGNACTEQFIHDVCRFWLDEYQVDGIRLDNTPGYYDASHPDRGLAKLVADLRTELNAAGHQERILILEHLQGYGSIHVVNQVNADGCWYDQFYWDLADRLVRGAQPFPQLVRTLNTGLDFAADHGAVTYLENHDHSTLTTTTGGRSGWWRSQPAVLALFTTAGAVMLHNGQEWGQYECLPDNNPGRTDTPRPLDWAQLDDEIGQRLAALYRRLASIRAARPVLRTGGFYPWPYYDGEVDLNEHGYGIDSQRGLVIYHRWGPTADAAGTERIVVALNFSNDDQRVDIPFPTNGLWTDLLSNTQVTVSGWRLSQYTVNSHWGRVFTDSP
jgi:1,4-alpha-glucan branching enzyme